MTIIKNLIIDFLGKRNNNILNKIWHNNYITYSANLKNSKNLLIFDFDNRLGDSVYISILIMEILSLNIFNKIFIVTNKKNIIYDYCCTSKKIIQLIYKNKFDFLSKIIKFRKINNLTTINLDPGIRVIYFLAIRLINSAYNIGFNKELFNIININLFDRSISFNINHNQLKINDILNLFNNKYKNFEFNDFIFVKDNRFKFKLENNSIILINCISSDFRRKIDENLLNFIINNLYLKFSEIHVRSEYKIGIDSSQKIVSFNNNFVNFEACMNTLRKYMCIITIDTSFTHLSSLINIPTFVLFNDNNFNEYVWHGKMQKYASSNINYKKELILCDLNKFLKSILSNNEKNCTK